MDDKTLQTLTDLATKLGTTTEYLWGVMAFWTVFCVQLIRFVRRKTTTPTGPAARAAWSDDDDVTMAWVGVSVAVLIAAIVVGCLLPNVVTAFLNPEYWALRQILD